MALFNYATKEITLKIVYYGPGLSGKTTNIHHLHSALNTNSKGKLLSLSTESDRTLFFDFLPIEIGKIKEFSIRFQLYTVPGQVRYNATRKVVLKGADAVVFVADSQRDMKYQNLESFENMRENLIANNLNPDEIPVLFQYNKRDLKNVLSVSELNEDLNANGDYRVIEAEAVNGKGVEDSFQIITKLVLKDIARKHKIEIQPASGKTQTMQEKEISEAASVSVQPRPEEDIFKADDFETDDALSIITGEDSDFDGEIEEIFPYEPAESAKHSSVEPEAVQAEDEAGLIEADEYDISAEVSDDAAFDLSPRMEEPLRENETVIEVWPESDDLPVAEALRDDSEAELFESTVYQIDEPLDFEDDKGHDFDKELQKFTTVKTLDEAVGSDKKNFTQPARKIRDIPDSESDIPSDRNFSTVSDDMLALSRMISDMKAAILSLRNEMHAIKKSLDNLNETAANNTAGDKKLDDIKKEQQKASSTLKELVTLFNELRSRKHWFKF
jgi:mutual gliding-motility protein MglA